jgi:hypothetical protein
MGTCIECEKIIKGRADKKYCSVACKNNHHNRKSSTLSCQVRAATERLRYNRNIIHKLYASGIRIITQKALKQSAFDFSYLFQMDENTLNCLDYNIEIQSKQWIRISRLDEKQ